MDPQATLERYLAAFVTSRDPGTFDERRDHAATILESLALAIRKGTLAAVRLEWSAGDPDRVKLEVAPMAAADQIVLDFGKVKP